jgi:hypothetical protein
MVSSSWAVSLGHGLLSLWLESVASSGDGDNLSVVEQAIENGAGRRAHR